MVYGQEDSTEPPGQVFDIMDFINIETTGNFVDFGDLPATRGETHHGNSCEIR